MVFYFVFFFLRFSESEKEYSHKQSNIREIDPIKRFSDTDPDKIHRLSPQKPWTLVTD